MSDIVLACQNLSKVYRDGAKKLSVLNDVSLKVQSGQTIAIQGVSGSGKSTLLHLLGALDHPTTGEVFWGGQLVGELSEAKRCKLRNQYLGFIYQFHHLLPEFTALENVAMPLLLTNMSCKEILSQAKEILTKVGLLDRITHKPAQLSGGERQRVAIARALVQKPKCVLADEPTGNLDQKTASEIFELMLELRSDLGTSFVIVSHDTALCQMMDEHYLLIEGQLKA